MKLSIIASLGRNNEIGKENRLLCYLPADLKHFRKITLGHSIIMGRKTFDSLPNGILPDRENIIISRNGSLAIKNARVYTSLDFALSKLMNEEEVFIIGGAQIYQQTLPIVNNLYLTKVYATFPEADVFFPLINYSEWHETEQEKIPANTKNPYPISFTKYERLQ
ncbi:MAG: dihydrofolate reductase [Candidatus Azobacteroides pseudotrichonymphae]|uniref:Dihydrofolate reductase n=1 Tax=Azobacteroides pseudotrichonymphae genomovar. CFP2 TaxID=511995 RepID=B6YRF0_AZOPC|nr:dihydrofolate reductase [Candidatus Azobacteroides pseudotrichonymphae]MDR0530225.1 dihydrofolate reductase [Bacteroidales bacterium OttesenSCG-928-I14]BAG83772.1 dihydrofolate reductase [Candidatus Azobacteroides pseudotrichonymphae genomovar. CFP2]GMO35239.1 MAG: dihydrofolate reductase [Candidatus Azobacteroides pseudotrichonymphae]